MPEPRPDRPEGASAGPPGAPGRGTAAPVAALVREVSPRLADAELTHLTRQPVDLTRARLQHAAYVRSLEELGLAVRYAPALPEQPDGVFVEDAVVVVDHLAVLTRPGAPSRRDEPASLHAALQAHGLTIAAIEGPGTLDGGDVFQLGDTVYVGRSTRTDDRGIEQLDALVTPLGRQVVPVDVHGVLHLKTAATPLPDGRIVADLDAVSADAFPGRELLAAPEASGADVLVVGDTVVVAASAPRTAAMLRDRGHRVRAVDIGELEKVEAGPTCPSVLLPDVGPSRAT